MINVLNKIFSFISTHILGLKWLEDLIKELFVHAFGETFANDKIGRSIQFFIYDFIKLSYLLLGIIFFFAFIQSYFPPERTKKILRKVKGIKGNILGALLGTVTPFCSCSSIPIFIGFTRAGLSSGVTFSFLISSPLVDLTALVLLTTTFGIEISIAYVIVGIVLAVIGGTIIEKTGLGKNIEPFVYQGENVDIEEPTLSFKERLSFAREETKSTYKKVYLYILISILIGAVIHNAIPQRVIELLLGNDKPYSVLIATIIGAPIYADMVSTIGIAGPLYLKGAGIGTILAFMMSVTTLSVPSLVMLKRVVKSKLLVAFIIIVMVGIIIIGYLFNAFGYLLI